MNVQRSLIRELMFYEFEMNNKRCKNNKDISFEQGPGRVDYCTETR